MADTLHPECAGHSLGETTWGAITLGGIVALGLFYAAWGFAYMLFFIQYLT